MAVPTKLYKYRKFDVKALNMITDHGLHYADPRKFNDPLDCDLSILPDIGPRKLSDLLKAVVGPERKHHWSYEVESSIHYAG